MEKKNTMALICFAMLACMGLTVYDFYLDGQQQARIDKQACSRPFPFSETYCHGK
jgi:hypothetical protein